MSKHQSGSIERDAEKSAQPSGDEAAKILGGYRVKTGVRAGARNVKDIVYGCLGCGRASSLLGQDLAINPAINAAQVGIAR